MSNLTKDKRLIELEEFVVNLNKIVHNRDLNDQEAWSEAETLLDAVENES